MTKRDARSDQGWPLTRFLVSEDFSIEMYGMEVGDGIQRDYWCLRIVKTILRLGVSPTGGQQSISITRLPWLMMERWVSTKPLCLSGPPQNLSMVLSITRFVNSARGSDNMQ